jgi:Tol biopolymer transport system component
MRRLATALASLATAACTLSGLPDAELPQTPIAVVNRTPEDSRQRAEALQEHDKNEATKRGAPPPSSSPETVPRVKDVERYLKSVISPEAQEAIERRFPGRLALLDPRTRKVEPLAAAWGDAVPHAWSEDHTKLLFTALVDQYAQLFEYDMDKGEVRPITHGPEAHPSGCYGPGGSYVLMTAAVVADEPRSWLEILEPRRTNPRPLTPGPRDHSPTCAADGSSVVYVTDPSRGVQWLMARDPRADAEPKRLGPGSEPSFCAGSEWFVYSAPIQRGTKIWRMRADGTGRSPVGSGVLDETAPACSPDGRLVVYNVVENYREILYVRRFDGSGDRILYSDSSATHPVW